MSDLRRAPRLSLLLELPAATVKFLDLIISSIYLMDNHSSAKTQYMDIWRQYPRASGTDPWFREVHLVAFSPGPCSRYVAFAGERGVLLLSADSGSLVATLSSQGILIKAFAWCFPDNLVCAYSNGNIADIRVTQDRLDVTVAMCTRQHIDCLAVDRNGKYLATAAGEVIKTWRRKANGSWAENVTLGSSLPMRAVDQTLPVIITSLSWYETPGQLLIVSYRFHGIHLWDVQSTSVLRTVVDPGGMLGTASISVDQKYLATVTEDGVDVIRIQDKTLGRRPVYADSGVDYPVIFLHGGRAVLTSTLDGNVRLATRDGTSLQTLRHRDMFVPSGDIVFATATDSNVLTGDQAESNRKYRICTVSHYCICMWETTDRSARNLVHANNTQKAPRPAFRSKGWKWILASWYISCLFALVAIVTMFCIKPDDHALIQ
ncbi:hypothetical protein NM688_g3619 [Phlebia brevispora]|uniref:Uncharacterized protein n=1 Tax=Phlebia brevispora TaxID=194682 RepID=A0ACC1T5C9_9APHY|nr:hypothetical protein NM688_g3619 [Phlebia brevispora]